MKGKSCRRRLDSCTVGHVSSDIVKHKGHGWSDDDAWPSRHTKPKLRSNSSNKTWTSCSKKGKRMKPTWLSSKISLLKCRTDLASPSFHTCACMLSTLQLVIAVRAGGGPGSRTPSATKIREADGARNKILTGPSCVRKFSLRPRVLFLPGSHSHAWSLRQLRLQCSS